MKRQDVLARLVSDVRADLVDYQHLHTQLQAQFQAAVCHDTDTLTTLAEEITALVETLDQRRRDRVRLAGSLLGGQGAVTIPVLMHSLPDAVRDALQPLWLRLEALVSQCKGLNIRNCHLMVEQQAIMLRVLHGEEALYAEA